ncbi:MAG: hypothetical protein Tsb0021_00940 [Chlamydiales bacterium]
MELHDMEIAKRTLFRTKIYHQPIKEVKIHDKKVVKQVNLKHLKGHNEIAGPCE